MNNPMKIVLLLLAIVFLLVVFLSLFGVLSDKGYWSLFNFSRVNSSLVHDINYDDYLNTQISVYGRFDLVTITCRAERDCDYGVVFVDYLSVFSNFSVYKNGRSLFCYDEYSREPIKYIGITCGLKYLDRTINREKFESVFVDFGVPKNYTFNVMRNLNEYYLELS